VRALLATLLLAAIVAAAPAAGGTPPPPPDELDGHLQAVVDGLTLDVFVGADLSGEPEAFYVPGAALSVSLPDEATRTYASGLAGVGVGDVVQADLVQPIGSGTKPMTAALLIRLVLKGRLRLGDELTDAGAAHRRDGGRLARLVRRFRHRLRGVTIRDLLAMTSGLRDYDDDPSYVRAFSRAPNASISLRRLAAFGLARSRLFAPGAKGRSYYSNTNYVLLGMLVEAVTGRTYADALERFLDGAGLDSTSYGWPSQTRVGGYANPLPKGGPALLDRYRKAFAPAPTVTSAIDPAAVRVVSSNPRAEGPTVGVSGASAQQEEQYGGPANVLLQDLSHAYSVRAAGASAGAVVSNTRDLARFWRELFSGELVGKRGLALIKRSVPGDPGSTGVRNYFTLGLARQDIAAGAFWPGSPKLRIYMKLGDIWGYTSASYYVKGPAPYGGVVVTNTTNLFPSPVGDLGVLRDTLQAIGGV
jgi:CubicO group peptidase (beta-lactamase class C family)